MSLCIYACVYFLFSLLVISFVMYVLLPYVISCVLSLSLSLALSLSLSLALSRSLVISLFRYSGCCYLCVSFVLDVSILHRFRYLFLLHFFVFVLHLVRYLLSVSSLFSCVVCSFFMSSVRYWLVICFLVISLFMYSFLLVFLPSLCSLCLLSVVCLCICVFAVCF